MEVDSTPKSNSNKRPSENYFTPPNRPPNPAEMTKAQEALNSALTDLSTFADENKDKDNPLVRVIANLAHVISVQQQQMTSLYALLVEQGSQIHKFLSQQSNQQQITTQPQNESQIDAEEKERRRSIVISGLPEPQGIPSVRAKEDSGSVVKLLDEIDAEATICSCYRLGARKTGANRLVKVVFSTSQQQKQVLRNAKKLKNSIQFKKIFLRPSLTLEQRQRESQLWEECKKLREDPKNRGKVKIVGGPPGHPNRKVVIDSGNQ